MVSMCVVKSAYCASIGVYMNLCSRVSSEDHVLVSKKLQAVLRKNIGINKLFSTLFTVQHNVQDLLISPVQVFVCGV